jgi:hypothetical protein
MYAILRDKEKYLCDKTVPHPERIRINSDGTVTIRMSSVWQTFDDTGCAYAAETYDEALSRKNRLRKIYSYDTIEVVRLTDDQIEELTFKKLKYSY